MIPKVTFSKSGLITSQLGFGTSRLHHVGRKTRERLLDTAVDLGFTHIDTAPCYGDTLAEAEIGSVLRSKRDRLVIASKYGIPASLLLAATPAIAPLLRAARSLARRGGFLASNWPPISANGLQQSVEQSLRRLRTGWLDILLLHEPSPARLQTAESVYRMLCDMQDKGYIRYFGLAGSWNGIFALDTSAAPLGQVIQTGESEWPSSYPPDITYGAMAVEPQSYFADSPNQAFALERLRSALARRDQGTIIVSTTKPERLQILAETIVS
jgi:aryl-alcohol dehydrogenase-like predicted oxidoreductase